MNNRKILADIIPLDIPFTIQIEPSQFCNLKCNYCIQAVAPKKGKHMMTMEVFELATEQMKSFSGGLKQVNFAGWGEPLVNKDLPLMVKMLKENKIAENIAVVTNGLLLTQAMSSSLIEAGVNHIRVSLQGMESKRYMEVSKKKMSFDSLVKSLAYLYSIKGNTKLSIKLADVNITEKEEELFYNTFLTISDIAYIEYIRPVFEHTPSDGKIVSKFGDSHKPVKICPQPFYMMAITAIGGIYPCCSYYDPAFFGNIKKTTLKEVWGSLPMKDFYKRLLNKKATYCNTCNIPDVIILPEDNLDGSVEKIKEKLNESD